MIDSAMFNPAASPQANRSPRGPLATPKAAHAFSAEFGAALRTMHRKESNTPGDGHNAVRQLAAKRAGEGAEVIGARTPLSRSAVQPSGREPRADLSVGQVLRAASRDHDAKLSQPNRGVDQPTTRSRHDDPNEGDPSVEATDDPNSGQAVDELKHLLTLGALASAEGNTPLPPGGQALVDAGAPTGTILAASTDPIDGLGGLPSDTPAEALSPEGGAGANDAERSGSPLHARTPADSLGADGLNMSAAASTQTGQNQLETALTGINAAADSHIDQQLDGAVSGFAHTDAASSASAQGADGTQSAVPATASTPGQADLQMGLPTSPAESVIGTSPEPGLTETSATPVAEGPDGGQPATTGTSASPTSSGASSGEMVEGAGVAQSSPEHQSPEHQSQGDTPADQGEGGTAQQPQPAQSVQAKADSGTPQPLIGGVQAPTQLAGAPATAAGTAQMAQPGQPQPTQLLTPAQQLASALGALRRRGDGSFITDITLNPKELGQVRLQVQVAGNTVHMQAAALDPATRALLHAGLDDLSQALIDAGLNSGHLDVSQGDAHADADTDAPFPGFGLGGVEAVAEEDLALPAMSTDYVTSTGVYTLA